MAAIVEENEILIPRLNYIAVSKQDLSISLLTAFQKLGYDEPTPEQTEAIIQFMCGRDVFVILPTSGGKSLCFVTLPLVFDYLRNKYLKSQASEMSIVVVVSPLVSLMKDQVQSYSSKGIKCSFIRESMNESEKKAVLNGKYQVLYASPESLLTVDMWRDMLSGKQYLNNLIAVAVDEAHCVDTW